MPLMSVVVQAKLSEPTGQIEGRAPTVAGTLFLAIPNGDTVNNYAIMDDAWRPNDINVSIDTTDLTLSDLDGDCVSPLTCTATVDVAEDLLVWKSNGTPLTTAQLAASFSPQFSGKTLTVSASAPVTAVSSSGVPNTAVRVLSTETYTVVVPNPMIRVNGRVFPINTGFPRTGWQAATFDFLMDGTTTDTNSYYIYTSNQPWVTVSSTGQVSFQGTPSSSTKSVSITVTPRHGATENPVFTYVFTMEKWFMPLGRGGTWNLRDSIYRCTYNGWAVAQYLDIKGVGPNPYGPATMYGEWGNLLGSWSSGRSGYYIGGETAGTYVALNPYDGSLNASANAAMCALSSL
ncbi:hypothetical protein [Budvicia aquatica]